MRYLIKHIKAAIYLVLVWLVLAAPALAQSPADCPRHWLETETVEGTYIGRECPDVCRQVVKLDDGEILRLLDNLEDSSAQLGPPGGRVRVSYDLVVTWNLVEQFCEDSFIFKSGRPVVRAPEEEGDAAAEGEAPVPLTEEDCPTQILMLGEAEGIFMGETCQGGDCQIVLHLDDGLELRLENEGERRLNIREVLGRPGDRVAVTYEQSRSWNQYRKRCEIRGRLVAGRNLAAAEEAAGESDDHRYDSWW